MKKSSAKSKPTYYKILFGIWSS